MNKLQNRQNQPTADKVLNIILFIAAAAVLMWTIASHRWDPDCTWIIAQGRDILQNGFTHTDNFRILPDMNITVQGWLFYVIAALFDKIGTFGILIFTAIITCTTFAAGYLYLSQHHIRAGFNAITVALIILLTEYGATPRPNAVTIAMLTFECIAFERYRNTKNWKWLLILPAGMLLEANFHSSMMWMHYLIAAAYIVPSVWRKGYLTYIRKWKLPLLFTAVMIPFMFVSPYGLDGVLYLPKSLLGNTFSYIDVKELKTDFVLIAEMAIAIIGIYLLSFVRIKRPHLSRRMLYNYQVYMVLGCFIMTVFATRNVMFMFPALLTIAPAFLRHIDGWSAKSKTYVSELAGIIALFSFFMAGINIAIMVNEAQHGTEYMVTYETVGGTLPIEADRYMRSKSDISDVHLFAGFNTGGLFEYYGYDHVYMDARPENRLKIMNGQRDELPEYCKYCLAEGAAGNEIQSWIDEYGFDYIYVDKEFEIGLYEYLQEDVSGWTLIMEDEGGAFYERN